MKSRATLYISCMFSAFLISDVPLQIKLALCKQQLRLLFGGGKVDPMACEGRMGNGGRLLDLSNQEARGYVPCCPCSLLLDKITSVVSSYSTVLLKHPINPPCWRDYQHVPVKTKSIFISW